MSMSLNRAMIIGNLTRDPESRSTATGQSVCNFAVATSSQWTDAAGAKQERTEYHNIVVWGKLAEICSQYLNKGKKVYVEGRLQTREWEAQDGAKRRTTEIVADSMIMLDRGGSGGASPSPTVVPTTEPTQTPTVDHGMGEQVIRVEDIPF